MSFKRYSIVLVVFFFGTNGLYAMEQHELSEVPVMYCLNERLKHYVCFYPTILSNTLAKLKAIGDADAYALVRLKYMADPVDSKIADHRKELRGKKIVQQYLLKQYGMLSENNGLDLNTKAIVELAVIVEKRNVLVAAPAWFEERRVKQVCARGVKSVGEGEVGQDEIVFLNNRD